MGRRHRERDREGGRKRRGKRGTEGIETPKFRIFRHINTLKFFVTMGTDKTSRDPGVAETDHVSVANIDKRSTDLPEDVTVVVSWVSWEVVGI